MPDSIPKTADPLERIQCQWCQGMNEKTALTCRACGAPLDIRNLVSESGWREAPRLRDMTEFSFSSSTCQVEGEIVPVAEIHLGANDSVFFEHHIMLWKDDNVPLSVLQLPGGLKRAFAGMPFIISVATGPGTHRFFPRRHWRTGGAAAASWNGAGRSRTRLCAGLASDRLFLRAQ